MLCQNTFSRTAILLGLLAIAATAWTAEPAAVPADSQKETPAQRIERALDKIVDIDFDDHAWLSDVLKFLEEKHGIKTMFDSKALEDARALESTHVKFRVKSVTLRSALRWLLSGQDLTAIIQDGTLVITSKSVADDLIDARVYPVLDLVTDSDVGVADVSRKDFVRLKDLLWSTVRPDGWTPVGGPGSLEAMPAAGALLVSQTQENHEHVAEALAMLRRVRNQQFAGGNLKPMAQRSWEPVMNRASSVPAIRQALAKKNVFELLNVPLHEAVESIGKQWGVPVLIDLGKSKAGDTLVSLRENDWRLDAVLNRQLGDLRIGWTIRDEVVLVTWAGDKRTMVLRMYPVSDLVTYPRGEHELIESLRNTIQPDYWTTVGGDGVMEYFANAGALVVLHNEQTHSQLQMALTQLREARDEQLPPDAEARAADGNDAAFSLKIYKIPPIARPTQMGVGLYSIPDKTPKHSQTSPQSAEFGGMVLSPAGCPAAPVADLKVVGPTFLSSIVGAPDPSATVRKTDTSPPVDPTADLAKVIPQVIDPESWKESGGKGVIQALPGRLVVLQNSRVHQKIARFLREVQ